MAITDGVFAYAHNCFYPDQNWEVIPEDDAISEDQDHWGGGTRGPSVFAGAQPREVVLHEHEWTGAFEAWLQDPPVCIIAESPGQLFLFQESFQPCGKACDPEYLVARVPLRPEGWKLIDFALVTSPGLRPPQFPFVCIQRKREGHFNLDKLHLSEIVSKPGQKHKQNRFRIAAWTKRYLNRIPVKE